MCVKSLLEILTLILGPPHPTSAYTCGVTITLKVRDGGDFLT